MEKCKTQLLGGVVILLGRIHLGDSIYQITQDVGLYIFLYPTEHITCFMHIENSRKNISIILRLASIDNEL